MPAKKHDFTATEIKAGVMVIASAVVLVGFIAVIQGYRPQRSTATYYAHFTKTIGLNLGADVRFGGVKVGRVSAIGPAPEDQSQIRVQVEVLPDTPVNAESIATIEQIGLTSARHFEISTGKTDAERLERGGMIRSVTLSGGFVELPDLSGVVTKVEDLLDDVMAFLGVDEAQELEAAGGEQFAQLSKVTGDVRKTLDESTGLVKDLRDTLKKQTPKLEEILGKVTEIEDGAKSLIDELNGVLKENREPLNKTLTGVQDLVTDAQGMIGELNKVVSGLSGRLDELVNTLQKTLTNTEGLTGEALDFLETNRPALEDALRDLKATLRYVQDFSRTLAEQPQSIIRGREPQGRKH